MLGLIAIMAPSVRAAEPEQAAVAGPQENTFAEAAPEVTEPVIPERRLDVEISDEEYSVNLPAEAMDPMLLQQRYVAVFRLPMLPPPQFDIGEKLLTETSADWARERDERYRLLTTTGVDRFFLRDLGRPDPPPEELLPEQVWASWFQGGEGRLFVSDFPAVFAAIGREMPPERRPSPEVLSSLTTETDVHVKVEAVTIKLDARIQRSELQFEVYAPTPGRAEELVRAIFAVYDYGFSYPLQEMMTKARRDSLENAAEVAEAYEKAKEKAAQLEKEIEPLTQYADISAEMLSDLKTQQRMIEIEMVGVEARIKACQTQTAKRMKEPIADSPLLDQIVGLKVAAEIELAGLAAKKAAMQETIEGAEQLATARRELAPARGAMSNCERESSRLKNAAVLYAELRERAEPLAVEDGKVTIHPIKWAPAAEK